MNRWKLLLGRIAYSLGRECYWLGMIAQVVWMIFTDWLREHIRYPLRDWRHRRAGLEPTVMRALRESPNPATRTFLYRRAR